MSVVLATPLLLASSGYPRPSYSQPPCCLPEVDTRTLPMPVKLATPLLLASSGCPRPSYASSARKPAATAAATTATTGGHCGRNHRGQSRTRRGGAASTVVAGAAVVVAIEPGRLTLWEAGGVAAVLTERATPS